MTIDQLADLFIQQNPFDDRLDIEWADNAYAHFYSGVCLWRDFMRELQHAVTLRLHF